MPPELGGVCRRLTCYVTLGHLQGGEEGNRPSEDSGGEEGRVAAHVPRALQLHPVVRPPLRANTPLLLKLTEVPLVL